jgi:hypothetical protein
VYGFVFSTLLVANLLVLSAGSLLWMRGLGDWRWLPAAAQEVGSAMARLWGRLDGNPGR